MVCHSVNALAEFLFEMPKLTSWVKTIKKNKVISKCSCVSFMSIWAEKHVFGFFLQKLAYFMT